MGSRRGLVNLGNTCFLNSILQCLSASGPFSAELAQLSGAGLGNVGQALCGVFEELRRPPEEEEEEAAAAPPADADALALGRIGGAAVSPNVLLERLAEQHPEYKGREQQDAHELLRTLLGALSDELTAAEREARAGAGGAAARPRHPSGAGSLCEDAVWRSFRGHLCEVSLCWECCRVSARLDPFLDLSVDLPEEGPRAGPLGVAPAALRPLAELRVQDADPELAEGDAPGGEEQEAAEEATEPTLPRDGATHEVRLSRPRAGRRVPWGFRWEEELQGGQLVVAGITPGSPLDRWRSSPEAAAAGPVRPGDRLVSANGATAAEDVRAVLKDDFEVIFRLQRQEEAPSDAAEDKPDAAEEEDAETETRPIFVVEHGKGWAADLKASMQAAGLTKKDVRVLDQRGSVVDPFLAPPDASRFPLSFWRLEEPGRFEVVLERDPSAAGGKAVPWGFRWSDDALRHGQLVLALVPEDSPVGRWNAALRGPARKAQALQPGDAVVSANGARTFEKIRAVIKSENRLKLLMRRPPGAAAAPAPAPRGAAAPEAVEEGEGAAEDARFEIELERRGNSEHGKWGFEWNEERAKEAGELAVATVLGGSLLADWNARCEALGEEDRVVSNGDRLLVVNGKASQRDMLKALKSEAHVTLTFARGRLGRARLREKEAAAYYGEVNAGESEAPPLPPAQLAELERRRQRFSEAAGRCLERLAPGLQGLFAASAEAPLTGAPGAAAAGRRSLVNCLESLTAVEALEDGYEPIYRCPECGSGSGPRTFASKRVWLWPPLPPILAIQIKRFRIRDGSLQKSPLQVDLPAEIDVSSLEVEETLREQLAGSLARGAALPPGGGPAAAPARYELRSACVHRGRTLQRGHYLAFVNLGPSLARERWLAFDDARAWPCRREDALRAQAYVAFYRRCEAEA